MPLFVNVSCSVNTNKWYNYLTHTCKASNCFCSWSSCSDFPSSFANAKSLSTTANIMMYLLIAILVMHNILVV